MNDILPPNKSSEKSSLQDLVLFFEDHEKLPKKSKQILPKLSKPKFALPRLVLPKQVFSLIYKFSFVLVLILIAIPFLPRVEYYIQSFRSPNQIQLPTLSLDSNDVTVEAVIPAIDESQLIEGMNANVPPESKIFWLDIPKIGVSAEVLEGENESVLDKGIWHKPSGSTPDLGGNTIITAHRFMFKSGPKTFYNLDKVSVGDPVSVYWNSKEYKYIVSETKVVESSEVNIENQTIDPMLTLYTCTPIWTSSKRLVVIARPVASN